MEVWRGCLKVVLWGGSRWIGVYICFGIGGDGAGSTCMFVHAD